MPEVPSVPLVRTFLGFIDLRMACLVIAGIRLVISAIALLVLLFWFILKERLLFTISEYAGRDGEPSFGALEFFIVLFFAILAAVLGANSVASYWYIQGVLKNKTHKMRYYLWVQVAIIVLILFSYVYNPWRIERLTMAAVESYIYVCSNSLYQECLINEYNENIINATQNTAMKLDTVPQPAPVYNSCDDNSMQLQQTQPDNSNPFKE